LWVKAIAAVAVCIAMALGGTSYASSGSGYLNVLNEERAAHGVPPLRVSADLVRVAQEWVAEMARTGLLRHNPRLESDVANWWSVGENVGMGADLPDIEQAFWNSPDHRSNILDAHYTDVGIATAYSDGRIWVTVVFRQPWHRVSRRVTHHVVPMPRRQRASSTSEPTASPSLLMRGMSFGRLWTWR
jgi:hypothetical protein